MIAAENPPPTSGGRGDTRYLFVLIFIAVGVLAAGIWLRPKHAPPAPISESEALRLQMQAQRRELEKRTIFFSIRARQLVGIAEQARTRPASVPSDRPVAGERLIVVVATPGGEALWIDTAVAGVLRTTCNGISAEEIVISSPLPTGFAGGAAFNLDSQLAGIVSSCGAGNALLTPTAFAMQAERLAVRKLQEVAGLRVRIEAEAEPPGARVLEVRTSSVCAAAGLQAGDLITHANEVPVTTLDQIISMSESADFQLRVVRDGRELTLDNRGLATGSGVRWLDGNRSAQVVSVLPGSVGAKWGLRPGDVVLRAGARRSPRPSSVEVLLSRNSDIDLVVLRDRSELLLERAR